MRTRTNTRRGGLLLSLAFLLTLINMPTAARPALSAAAPEPAVAQSGNVGVNGFFSVDPAQQGSTFQAAVVLDIPRGLHVNANKPLGKYAVPTKVTVEPPRGLRVTPVVYPRGKVMSFPFAPSEKIAVYEGLTPLRFNVTVPPNYELGVARIRVVVNYQSCSDEVCFPPKKAELTLPIAIVNRDTPVNRINARYFGNARRRG
ncbi:MAG TPA: protein-disulfide reductase DsbD domain-containing protein [Pyrinomonadaceae bacterium]|nr:protein-disulfide reductase DsbD domain-containing protein [Pyrinomonadaceae bacterium]